MSDDSTTPDDGTDTGSGPADPPDGTTGGLSKRTLIRLLVGFGIGIPLLVEGLTFLGLLRDQFGGSGGDGADGSGSTSTAADDGGAVGVGDDMLPETDRSETLVGAVLRESEEGRWPLSLTVDVTNTGSTDYEFQLLGVHLEDGRSVDGRTSTDRLAPEENRTVTAERSIPAGSTPAAVAVVALIYREETVETVERRVDLAKIPVRGG